MQYSGDPGEFHDDFNRSAPGVDPGLTDGLYNFLEPVDSPGKEIELYRGDVAPIDGPADEVVGTALELVDTPEERIPIRSTLFEEQVSFVASTAFEHILTDAGIQASTAAKVGRSLLGAKHADTRAAARERSANVAAVVITILGENPESRVYHSNVHEATPEDIAFMGRLGLAIATADADPNEDPQAVRQRAYDLADAEGLEVGEQRLIEFKPSLLDRGRAKEQGWVPVKLVGSLGLIAVAARNNATENIPAILAHMGPLGALMKSLFHDWRHGARKPSKQYYQTQAVVTTINRKQPEPLHIEAL